MIDGFCIFIKLLTIGSGGLITYFCLIYYILGGFLLSIDATGLGFKELAVETGGLTILLSKFYFSFCL